MVEVLSLARAKAQRRAVQRTQADLVSRLQRLALDQGLCVEKGAVAAAAVDHVELALLIENGGMVAGDEGVRQYQVAVLQPPDGERRVRNVDLFLPGFVDQQQSSGWNWFGHKVPFE